MINNEDNVYLAETTIYKSNDQMYHHSVEYDLVYTRSLLRAKEKVERIYSNKVSYGEITSYVIHMKQPII